MLMSEFTVYPAIDLRRGQVVRLRQGDSERQTTYASDPRAVAQDWIDSGANWLHVVNLDGAFGEESQSNIEALRSILQFEAQVQLGGGLRTISTIESALDMGVERVILGTVAIENPDLIDQVVAAFGGDRVVVGIDAREGKVRIHGWRKGSGVDPIELAKKTVDQGVRTSIVTDITRDGMDEGVNLDLANRIQSETGLAVIAAGGVNSLQDVQRAKAIGLQGIIIGRALYEGQVSLVEALKC
jgi:phosphoribosylformimino-5-aminoimidazole carboxamide ribotide isomerase